MNHADLAREVLTALQSRQPLQTLFTIREPQFDLAAAYAVQREIAQQQVADGHRLVGRKVGFANKAVWRALKIETVAWAPMYDSTVRPAASVTPVRVGRLWTPKIEPEIVLTLRRPLVGNTADAASVLADVESIALGFEIVDSPFTGSKPHPADFVAAYGFHVGLIVGRPRTVDVDEIPALVDQLAQFSVRLLRNGEVVAEGGGRNVLRSPALCLGELASAVHRQSGEMPLRAGDIVSSGSLTDPQRIAADETWTATVDGIDLPDLTIQTAE